MKFYIDINYVTSITVTTEHKLRQQPDETEADFLVRKLSSSANVMRSISTEDHPEFTALRERLGAEGYITIQRSFWNGDRVIKPFELNDVKFFHNDTFYCGSAMPIKLKRRIP